MVRADRSNHGDIPRAAHAGHFGAVGFGDLHREGAHTSRRSIDQYLLPAMNLCVIPKTLQGGERCHGHSRSLLERDARRLQHDLVLRGARELGERAGSRGAEDLVARLELRHIAAHRHDLARQVDAQPRILRFEHPDSDPNHVRAASHVMPIEGIGGSGANPDQHLIFVWKRLFDLFEAKHVGRTIVVVNDGLHRLPASAERHRRRAEKPERGKEPSKDH